MASTQKPLPWWWQKLGFGRNPVYQGSDDGWYHYDETWRVSAAYGPFATESDAKRACIRYAKEL